ncbi:MAG TPA: M1 family aminopeptidase [Ignavibacteriaceae bacterium]|nr:M1 family aminopeptidase [Ignavibacteriaceae bacterium]
MKSKIFLFLLFSFNILIAQTVKEKLAASEKEQFIKNYKISKVTYPGDSNIDVLYYKLNLSLTHQPNNLSGIVTVSLKPVNSSIDSFFLDLQNNFTVDSVLLEGSKQTFSQPSGQAKLIINLYRTFTTSEKLSIDIYYHGIPGSSGFGSFTFGTDGNGGEAIYTLSEPYGASDWWPNKDTPADKVDSSDVWITIGDNLTGVSNGSLESVTDNGNSTKTFKWKNHYPIASYLISLAIAGYSTYDTYYHYAVNDSMPITNYLYPQSNTEYAHSILDKVANMIKIYADHYGPYPFLKEKYGHAQFGWSGGMEHQTITSLGVVDENLIAHELGHQWFGDKVTCATWHDIWLNESFATFSESIYYENAYGKASYDSDIASKMNIAKTDNTHSVYVEDISSVNSIFRYTTTYAKGAVVLHMLRGVLGDSTFFNILKTYNSDPRFAYGSATTGDFKSVAESLSGKDLTYFFEEWIYGKGYPNYKYNWNFTYAKNNMYRINLTVGQDMKFSSQLFSMPIQIKITTDNSDTTITIFNDIESQDFTFMVNGIPTGLVFDPGNYIMKEGLLTEQPKEIFPDLYLLENNFPNPFNPATTIRYFLPRLKHVKLIITDVLGQRVTTLVDEVQPAGRYTVPFNASKLSSGIYYYTLVTDEFRRTKKMVLVK